jgi:hypothetical protein
MLVSCGNPNCHIQYADSLRACPVCSTPKPERSIGADAKPDQRAGVSLMGILYSTLAVSSLLGLIGAAITANLFAIAIGAVMTFVWGRLAVTAFEENSVK